MNTLYQDIIQSKKTLTERLLDEIVDYDIYCELTGIDIELGRPICSPIREDDDTPSFSLFIPTRSEDVRPDEVWWRDFRDGSGDVFKFVKLFAAVKYGEELTTRYEVIRFLDSELDLGLFSDSKKVNRIPRNIDYIKAREEKVILFTSRPWTRRDRLWWCERAVDTADLTADKCMRSVHYLLDEEYNIKHTFRNTDLAFAQICYDKVKIYCPESIDFKWRNTCPAHYILGEEQCSRNDVLIITKSLKDIQTFKSLIFCDAIAPQGEGQKLSPDYMQYLLGRYKLIYVVMDYDSAGILATEQYKDPRFMIRWVSTSQLILNGKTTVLDKDISDFVYSHGVQAGLDHVKIMFKEIPQENFRNDRPEHFAKLKAQIFNE